MSKWPRTTSRSKSSLNPCEKAEKNPPLVSAICPSAAGLVAAAGGSDREVPGRAASSVTIARVAVAEKRRGVSIGIPGSCVAGCDSSGSGQSAPPGSVAQSEIYRDQGEGVDEPVGQDRDPEVASRPEVSRTEYQSGEARIDDAGGPFVVVPEAEQRRADEYGGPPGRPRPAEGLRRAPHEVPAVGDFLAKSGETPDERQIEQQQPETACDLPGARGRLGGRPEVLGCRLDDQVAKYDADRRRREREQYDPQPRPGPPESQPREVPAAAVQAHRQQPRDHENRHFVRQQVPNVVSKHDGRAEQQLGGRDHPTARIRR